MANFAIAAEALRNCLKSWQLWLIQFVANLLLFGLFAAWLLIPVANAGYLVLNILFVLLLLVAALVLHAGTLNYFYSQSRNEGESLKKAFAPAVRNFLAVVVCAVAVYFLWLAAGKLDAYQETLPAYLRSMTPVFLRKHAGLPVFQGLFDAILFALRWILVPGLVLPFLAGASHSGFRGFGRQGLTAWKKAVRNVAYWGVVILSALLGVLATQKIMGWTPDFRTSTFAGETVSLIFRGLASYLLGLFAWLLACSVAGREGGDFPGGSQNVGGQASA
ncbi:MAG TPA: hypothetical protein VI431_09015 [Candidatus Acidoferrum sp.]